MESSNVADGGAAVWGRPAWDALPRVTPALWKAGLAPGPGETAWEFCSPSGRDGFLSWAQSVVGSALFTRRHCTRLHAAGWQKFAAVAGRMRAGAEWPVLRFVLKPGAPVDVELLPTVWVLSDDERDAQEPTVATTLEGRASVMRRDGVFSVYVVLPKPGVYGLRIHAAFGPTLNQSEGGRRFAQASDFLLDASAPPPRWQNCVTCQYPRVFGPAGDVTVHAPRQRRLALGHSYNIVVELAEASLTGTGGTNGRLGERKHVQLVLRSNATHAGIDCSLRRTSVGTLLGVPPVCQLFCIVYSRKVSRC